MNTYQQYFFCSDCVLQLMMFFPLLLYCYCWFSFFFLLFLVLFFSFFVSSFFPFLGSVLLLSYFYIHVIYGFICISLHLSCCFISSKSSLFSSFSGLILVIVLVFAAAAGGDIGDLALGFAASGAASVRRLLAVCQEEGACAAGSPEQRILDSSLLRITSYQAQGVDLVDGWDRLHMRSKSLERWWSSPSIPRLIRLIYYIYILYYIMLYSLQVIANHWGMTMDHGTYTHCCGICLFGRECLASRIGSQDVRDWDTKNTKNIVSWPETIAA